ncbi:MAG: hypothetical protein A2X35_00815 [Elusimicrobia bacterium GWA2_61_42]|nr:MAG: hypothetical protein A2X35_00815 [Elusimicrobia bacterium GWA2_61_42]OGR75243.1 MAG: hypothetical protein A2X38_04970 [Elusimicrobia bacterium GWC2_61_25]
MLLMNKSGFEELLREQEGPCVSVFMPTVKGSEETKQNPIKYKKLLAEAEKKLEAGGLRAPAARKFLDPARPLLEDHKFWQYQSGGLALFLSHDVKRVYTLPLNFSELAVVADHFCVTPVLPLFAEDGRFYVLALSQHSLRLYHCSRYSVTEVDLKQLPKSITDLLELNPREKQLQFHGNTEGSASRGKAAMFHGHGEDTDEAKDNMLVYFHNVNRGVNSMLRSDGAPLVLAGVDYLTRIYAKANTYPNLVGMMPGSAVGSRPEELREKAWELVKPLFEAGELAAVRQYERLMGTPKASNHIKTILKAAEEGKVGTLLVSANAQRWGLFDPDLGVLAMHSKPELSDTELVDLCATRTLHHGGKVHVLEQSKMPGVAPVAAILRY